MMLEFLQKKIIQSIGTSKDLILLYEELLSLNNFFLNKDFLK